MSTFPSLPLFVDAYMADAGHLTDAEHGRYLRLLMLMWTSPQCRIPNDDQWLARRLSRSADDVRNLFRPLISEFCKSTGNWITQKRLLKEWRYTKGTSKSQSDRAKSRWKKEKGICRSDADRHQSGNAPNPIPNPIKKEIDTRTRAKPVLISAEAVLLADRCRSSAGLTVDDLYGLDYQAQVWVERGYDPIMVLTTFVRIAQARPLKPLNYFIKAIESEASKPIVKGESHGANGQSGRRTNSLHAAIDQLCERFDREASGDFALREDSPRLLSDGGSG